MNSDRAPGVSFDPTGRMRTFCSYDRTVRLERERERKRERETLGRVNREP